MWSGGPQDADNPEALVALPKIRELLFAGQYREAQELADRTLIAKGAGSGHGRGANDAYGSYQTLGDLKLTFAGTTSPPTIGASSISTRPSRASTTASAPRAVTREAFASHPDRALVVRLVVQPARGCRPSRPGCRAPSWPRRQRTGGDLAAARAADGRRVTRPG